MRSRDPDRRSVLKWAALGTATLAGAAAAGGLVEASGVAAPSGGGRMELAGRGWRMVGIPRGQLPKPGTQLAITGELIGGQGQKIGEFYATSVYVGAPHGAGEAAASYLETHHFNLPGGTLVGSGTWHVSGPSRFAVVGGTGRFAGATGTYEAVQRPIQVGGDGTASFTFDLNTAGGADGR